MPGLKEIRNRMTSVATTQQITSAMKLVSASKLKRAQDTILKLRPYKNKFNEILQHLISSSEENISIDVPFISKNNTQQKNILIIPVTSNRGLCGSFNSNIIKTTLNIIKKEYSEQYNNNNLYLITIGKKATDFFKKNNYNVIHSYYELLDKVNFDNTVNITEKLMEKFINKEFDKCIIIYNYFRNAATQDIKIEQFLPIKIDIEKNNKYIADYIFEPNKKEIFKNIIPHYLKLNFYKIIAESVAAEHGARMTAMHKATDNAQEILKLLRLSYNKARQASITKEILEIVGGAEALKK